MFKKVLIANRGEIACRIIRTLQTLGIQSIAVFSEADKNAQHVQLADEAYFIGASPSRESYLNQSKIIEIAKANKVDAIHPGYGFLSENADFAEACKKNNLCFIGPPREAMLAMAHKTTAKILMQKANVPVIPGAKVEKQTPDALLKAAKKIGFPVLIKAALGGGGKGMRIVESENDFKQALDSAKREAKASFDDDTILIEKYLSSARHIEIQIFADKHGHVVHLFERDCSIQRRHQKIIEQATAPGINPTLRKQLGEAAIQAAKAIHYEGAGTIEFLVDNDKHFYFMEMNTRLQVEHPVTEMITGLDLVAWQIQVAAGEKLPITDQNEIKHHGHAIEARIYAEDPLNQFLPSTGQIQYLHTPSINQYVRIDSGIIQNDSISVHYDPMIAKLIVWDENRKRAISRLQQALFHFHVVGVKTNIAFLRNIIQHPSFISGRFNTHFIEQHEQTLLQEQRLSTESTLIIATLYAVSEQEKRAKKSASRSFDPNSPWYQTSSWQLNLANWQHFHFIFNDERVDIKLLYCDDHFQILLPNHHLITASASFQQETKILHGFINNASFQAHIIQTDEQLTIYSDGKENQIALFDPALYYEQHEIASGQLIAPMPGTIVAILVKVGDQVEAGMALLVIEAMKMEHTIYAPHSGIIKEFFYSVGDSVNEGVELLLLETKESSFNKEE